VPSRDFQVAIHLIYEDAGGAGYYSNVAFNGTVEVVDAPRLVDFEGLFMALMIAAFFGVAGARRARREAAVSAAGARLCLCGGLQPWPS
jgi:hypothetical protein